MDIIRRCLGGLFAMLGAYYCVLSALTFVRPIRCGRLPRRVGEDTEIGLGHLVLAYARKHAAEQPIRSARTPL